MVSAMAPLARRQRLTWVCAAGSDADRRAAALGHHWQSAGAEVRLTAIPPDVQALHYEVVSNPVLWFVQHGLTHRLLEHREQEIERAWDYGYRTANSLLAGAALQSASAGATMLIQDYQLYLVPGLLRRGRPDTAIAHFTHIPWPEPAAWGALSVRIVQSILRGMLSADVVGFQTQADATRFQDTCRSYLSRADVESEGVVRSLGNRTLVRSYPITIDHQALRAQRQISRYTTAAPPAPPFRPGMQTILRVDRLDPSKNIPAGFAAFGELLARAPHLHGKVRFLAHLVPTRAGVPEYELERQRAFAAADAVNRRYGSEDWQPVEIVHEENREFALAALEQYDVLLVNSVADGMNLVAKEGAVLNRRNGLIVLSRSAGAWEELTPWAIGVEARDRAGTAAALAHALSASPAEREARARGLRWCVERTSIDGWLQAQLHDLAVARTAATGRPAYRTIPANAMAAAG